jgi:predicted nucleotidyltransferase component of viral defense system
LQFYAIERFLYRLSQTRFRQRFVLKGAQMLRVWHAPVSRPTIDVDFLGTKENSVENLEQIVRECYSIEIEDGVFFQLEQFSAARFAKMPSSAAYELIYGASRHYPRFKRAD